MEVVMVDNHAITLISHSVITISRKSPSHSRDVIHIQLTAYSTRESQKTDNRVLKEQAHTIPKDAHFKESSINSIR